MNLPNRPDLWIQVHNPCLLSNTHACVSVHNIRQDACSNTRNCLTPKFGRYSIFLQSAIHTHMLEIPGTTLHKCSTYWTRRTRHAACQVTCPSHPRKNDAHDMTTSACLCDSHIPSRHATSWSMHSLNKISAIHFTEHTNGLCIGRVPFTTHEIIQGVNIRTEISHKSSVGCLTL